ncbi:MAG TPA: hypothetical protein VGF67_07815 [Ktedonobacteraceae bacterium]
MNESIYAKGTLVYVTSSGPLSGRKGTIRVIDVIGAGGQAPAVFYLVRLQDGPGKEVWLEHDTIAVVAGDTHASRLVL